jgi:hypothetical protein
MSATLTLPLSKLEQRLPRLRWELQQLRDGKLRTWADYGHGRIETTAATREALEDHLAMANQTLAQQVR